MPISDPSPASESPARERPASLEEVAGSVARELGGPLTAMEVALARLKRIADDDFLRNGEAELTVLDEQMSRLVRLTRQLVELARPLEPRILAVDLNTLARELVFSAWAEQGVSFALELESRLPLALGDPRQLRQAVSALVLNASMALVGWEGRKHLELRTRSRPDRVELRVSDSGPGIPTSEQDRIFLPFTSGWEGSGLGLPTARQILHAHGGGVEFEDCERGGATFILHLPTASAGV